MPEAIANRPTSLNKWRDYENPELGIQPIGSKSSFKRTHRIYGADVARIKLLADQLNEKETERAAQTAKSPKREYRSETARRLQAEHEVKALKREIAAVTGQWHLSQYRLQKSESELRYYERRVKDLETDLKKSREKYYEAIRLREA